MIFSIVRRAVARMVRERVVNPILGRVFDQCFRWVHDQQDWKELVSAASHAMYESHAPLDVRVAIAEAIMDIGPYLGSESLEVLQFIREIAVKHSPEAN